MTGFAVKVHPTNLVEIIDTDDVGLDFLQLHVGGYITPVTTAYMDSPPPLYVSMYVDEDGMSKGLGLNPLASSLGETPLLGNMVIVKSEGADDAPLNEDEMNDFIQWMMRVTRGTFTVEEE